MVLSQALGNRRRDNTPMKLSQMTKTFLFLFGLIIEGLLLVLILIFMVLGLLGIFLPVLPGIFLIGIGAGIYSLLLRGQYGKFTPVIHRRVVKVRGKVLTLKITDKTMGLIKNLKDKKKRRIEIEIVKNGLILLGFNFALILGLVFGFIILSLLGEVLSISYLLRIFIPLVALFVFSATTAVIWYRFGQILSEVFKKQRIWNVTLVVLISVLPLVLILILLSILFNLFDLGSNQLVAATFLGLLLMSLLAAIFELLLVNLGVITKV